MHITYTLYTYIIYVYRKLLTFFDKKIVIKIVKFISNVLNLCICDIPQGNLRLHQPKDWIFVKSINANNINFLPSMQKKSKLLTYLKT